MEQELKGLSFNLIKCAREDSGNGLQRSSNPVRFIEGDAVLQTAWTQAVQGPEMNWQSVKLYQQDSCMLPVSDNGMAAVFRSSFQTLFKGSLTECVLH